jgi:hypothetical protein
MLQTFAARRPSHNLRQIRTYQVAAVEHLAPFHHVAIATVFLDQPLDVIAALAVALGAFDAEHVELAFDVTEDQICGCLPVLRSGSGSGRSSGSAAHENGLAGSTPSLRPAGSRASAASNRTAVDPC